MEWKWYWGKWTSGQKDTLVSTSELTPWRWCNCAWKGSSLCPVSVRKRPITNHCFLRRWESSSALGSGGHGGGKTQHHWWDCGLVVTAVDAGAKLPGLTSRTDTSLLCCFEQVTYVFLYLRWFAYLELCRFYGDFKQLLVSLIFPIVFLFVSSLILTLIFIISLLCSP